MDELAHSREHSIEVQLPFLQAISAHLVSKVRIVPISLMLQDSKTAQEVGEDVSKVISASPDPVLVIASSDLTHYEPAKAAGEKDRRLLEKVERLDVSSYYTVLERLNISACGYGAIATVMNISKRFGMKRANVLKYATSGDTSGDLSSVVGYSSVRFS
jgi:AmmeMemoRadiSam system protein B